MRPATTARHHRVDALIAPVAEREDLEEQERDRHHARDREHALHGAPGDGLSVRPPVSPFVPVRPPRYRVSSAGASCARRRGRRDRRRSRGADCCGTRARRVVIGGAQTAQHRAHQSSFAFSAPSRDGRRCRGSSSGGPASRRTSPTSARPTATRRSPGWREPEGRLRREEPADDRHHSVQRLATRPCSRARSEAGPGRLLRRVPRLLDLAELVLELVLLLAELLVLARPGAAEQTDHAHVRRVADAAGGRRRAGRLPPDAAVITPAPPPQRCPRAP